MRTPLLASAACALLSLPLQAADGHPFGVDDLLAMERISSPAVSPDGERVVYVVRSTDLEANRGRTDLWLVGLDGSAPRRLTQNPASDSEPVWKPDGSGILFLSTRSGSSQVWELPFAGGEPHQVTDLPLDVANLMISPKGDRIAFSLEVFPDCPDLACTKGRLDEAGKNGSGVAYDRVFVRHWDTWSDGRRSHLFVRAYDAAADTEPADLTRGLDADVPSKPFGGTEELTFSPDGKLLLLTARIAGTSEPWSTNFDLYEAPADGTGEPRNLTSDNPAWDTQPRFSPDGRWLVYLAMQRAGYESDRFRLMLRGWPDGPTRVLAESWDRSAGDMAFSRDGKTLYVTAGDVGKTSLFGITLADGSVHELVAGGSVGSASPARGGVVYERNDMRSPDDLYFLADGAREPRRLTSVNAERLTQIHFGEPHQFSFPGWHGEKVYGYVVEPVDRRAGEKAPVAFLIHGGPQGSFGDNFHYRWNPEIYAGAGYAAVMVDFHGSTGYGQAFTDSIRNDYGGKPLEDLQKGLAAALEQFPFLDGDRVCALGASYGGYMINWIAGNWSDRFRCLVNHDGLFDNRSMYYGTEELWFPEWDHGGPYYANPEAHEKDNPARFVENWRTPMLVIHGDLDYRVPLTQGLSTFNALQRRGVPSRLLYFPDENHWVLKPRNSLQWHHEVLDWLGKWLGP